MQPRIYKLKDQEWIATRKDLTKGVFRKSLIPGGLTEVKIVLTRVKPGGEFSSHTDPYHHVFFILEGQGEGWLGERTYEIEPGLVVEVPAGEPHGYKNSGEVDLVLITVNIPRL